MNIDALPFLYSLAVMAGVTYLVRMLPLMLIRRKITNRYLNSFFRYIPYAVLAAMTLPDIFHSTSSPVAAAAGLAVAIVLSLFSRGLITVALGASAAVFTISLLLIK